MAMGMALGRVVAVQVEVDGRVVAVEVEGPVKAHNPKQTPARWFAVTPPPNAVLVDSVDPHNTNHGPA